MAQYDNEDISQSDRSGEPRSFLSKARHLTWLVPATAISVMTYSAMRLFPAFRRWLDAADTVPSLTLDPIACFAISFVTLVYWIAVDGKQHIARLIDIMLEFIRTERRKRDQRMVRKHHAEGHAQGRAEGIAEGVATTNEAHRAWIEDLRQRGLIDWPEDNPPPYMRLPAD